MKVGKAKRRTARVYPPLRLPLDWRPSGNDLRYLFTVKEANILDGIVWGDSNYGIGLKIGVTEGVVKNYLRVIYDKAGADSRLELALWWLEHGYARLK